MLDLLEPSDLFSVVADVKGRLTFKESKFRGPSSILILSGTAADHIGFKAQRGSVGKSILPGWKLAKRESLVNQVGYKIVFNSEVKTNPYFKVDYQVPRERCLRCRGTGIENDYRFDESGEALLVKDENLLYQSCVKFLLTKVGSNPYHRWYGTTLTERVGSKAVGGVANSIRS